MCYPFTFLLVHFESKQFLIFMKSNLSVFYFATCVFVSFLRIWRLTLRFPSNSSILFAFYIRVCDAFGVNLCVCCEVGVQLHSFACGYLVIPATLTEKSIPRTAAPHPLPLNSGPGTTVEDPLIKELRAYFWTLSSIPLTHMSICRPLSHMITQLL